MVFVRIDWKKIKSVDEVLEGDEIEVKLIDIDPKVKTEAFRKFVLPDGAWK